ncbi:hypothetical protein [Bradyrhizobium sp. BR13661]|jgi:hypothetical protein|uniref:hypothetical protein n=1 Tax=Bradyrhizobium sp. BR13661 TaxID=2940622 RepID=UPI0024758BA3|nr:hypothetical protein [Bradyrhizobium sp. BR13661]MDH6259076.1 hypothetical protein [Bradyrhizobium sp. BR13661]
MDTVRYLNRKEASEYLLERHGLRRTPKYLAKLGSNGTGPAFHKANRHVLYDPAELDVWAAKLIGPSALSALGHRLRANAA